MKREVNQGRPREQEPEFIRTTTEIRACRPFPLAGDTAPLKGFRAARVRRVAQLVMKAGIEHASQLVPDRKRVPVCQIRTNEVSPSLLSVDRLLRTVMVIMPVSVVADVSIGARHRRRPSDFPAVTHRPELTAGRNGAVALSCGAGTDRSANSLPGVLPATDWSEYADAIAFTDRLCRRTHRATMTRSGSSIISFAGDAVLHRSAARPVNCGSG